LQIASGMKAFAWLGAFAAVAAMAGCAANSGEDADSSTADLAQQKTILALGDSIAFAWDPTAPRVDGKVVASNYRGYAEMLGERLGLAVENSACPGEASGSFLDKNAEDNGCRKNRTEYKMHTDWGTAETQMEFAVSSLKKSIAAGNPPELVTLSMGGNDLLLLQKACKGWGFAEAGCDVVKLPFAEHSYGAHLEQIIKTIDDTGYRGTMVIVTTHAPDYSDAIANFGLGRFNGEIRESVKHVSEHLNMRVVVADGFEAFKAEADKFGGKTCETGLLVKNPDGKTCDIHPSAAGHKVLADAIQAALAE
jgi:lysophospholipase L1-like esterase